MDRMREPVRGPGAKPRVAVIHGSKSGSVTHVAQFIAQVLRQERIDASTASASPSVGLRRYDAVIVGSPVHNDRWRDEMRSFVYDNVADLRERPVWLFSVNLAPVDGEPRTIVDLPELAASCRPLGHAAFAGLPTPGRFDLVDRLARRVNRTPPSTTIEDWTAIEDWARDVARVIHSTVTSTAA